MGKLGRLTGGAGAMLAALGVMGYSQTPSQTEKEGLVPGRFARAGTVSPRFQSYNVEMVEVTGGRFWKPYRSIGGGLGAERPSGTPAGLDPNLFEYRPPIDLSNARLRRLAAALGPAYMRVSGTWANTTYFHDSAAKPPEKPPEGYNGVLTRRQWKGVVDFARAVNARIVTSFAISAGARDAAGVWMPAQAQRLLDYTKSIGGSIAAAEFMNEPNIAGMGGAPRGYDAASYARDAAVFRRFVSKEAPDMLVVGPGSVGEGGALQALPQVGLLKTEDLLAATGPVYGAFSYHLYGAVSKRCAGLSAAPQITADEALSPEWFGRNDSIHAFYAGLRGRFAPGKPIWITETADAACGGNPWGATFLDTFRYLDQHGRLARRGVEVIAHNTLAASDYGLLDENNFAPRPNYWAAWLWRRFMGTTVLDPGPSPSPGVFLYAHCLSGRPGGVALLAINADRQAEHAIQLLAESERYTLTAGRIDDSAVELNGATLQLAGGDSLPVAAGIHTDAGRIGLPPASITFLAVQNAVNASCR